MSKLNIGNDLYLKGRIGWQGLSKNEYLKNSEYKIINATALMDGYVDWNNCGFITKKRYDEAKEIQLMDGDILISKDGTLGKIGYFKNLTNPCSVSSGIFVLRNTKPEIVDFDYLYHIMKSNIFKNFINRNKSLGSTIVHLYQRDLEQFEIELPCISEQRKIAKILNNIDNQISRNNDMVQKLQVLSHNIFQFYYSKHNKRTVKLKDIAKMYQPETITGNNFVSNGKYYVYGSGGIIGKYDKYNHKDSELMISCRGKCGNIELSLPYSWIIGNQMIVKPTKIQLKYYLYNYFKIINLNKIETGSVQKQITRSNLEKLEIQLLNENILLNLTNKLQPIYKQIIEITLNNETINETKEKLLPLLINQQLV